MSYRRHRTSVAIALILSVGPGSRLDSTARLAGRSQAVAVAIRAIVETAPGLMAARAQLIALYSVGQYAPVWVDPSGRPTDDAQRAIRVLGAAPTEGLDPSDYSALAMQQSAIVLTSPNPAILQDVASFDVALSRNFLRYVHDLQFGRVEPATVGFQLPPGNQSISPPGCEARSQNTGSMRSRTNWRPPSRSIAAYALHSARIASSQRIRPCGRSSCRKRRFILGTAATWCPSCIVCLWPWPTCLPMTSIPRRSSTKARSSTASSTFSSDTVSRQMV